MSVHRVCQRHIATRQRLQHRLTLQLLGTAASAPHSFGPAHLPHLTRAITSIASCPVQPARIATPSSSSSSSRISRLRFRGFADEAKSQQKKKAKDDAAVPKLPTSAAPKVREVTKPPHPSSRPRPLKLAPPSLPASSSPLLTALDPQPDYDPADPVFSRQDPHSIHTPERLLAVQEKYRWINWSRYADFIHRSDVHFFDQEVKSVSENYDVRTDPESAKRLQASEEFEQAQEEETKRLLRLLPYTVFVTRGGSTRVTRYGKIRSIWVMLIAGDQAGTASFGIGKGEDAAEATVKAERDLRRNITFCPLVESRTFLTPTIGRFGVCRVAMQPLPRGAGMTAGVIPRLVFEAFGIEDVVAKVYGRHLPKHQVFAVWDGLSRQKSQREISIAQGVRIHRLLDKEADTERPPPRWLLKQRADEVGRKLWEMTVSAEDAPASNADFNVDPNRPHPETDPVTLLSEEQREQLIGMPKPDGSDIDYDDVADVNDGKEMDKDMLYWGIWDKPESYVPVLPGARPFIPKPQPAEPVQLGKGKRPWNRKP